MPLDKSGSKAAIGANIRAEQDAGRPHRQAVAIALSVDRKARGVGVKRPAKPRPGVEG